MRVATALAGTAALLTLVTGCSHTSTPTGSSTASPSRASGPTSGEPRVGQCRRLTTAQIAPATNDNPTVSCASAHTARTIAVANAPSSVPLKESSKSFQTWLNKACAPALRTAIGGTARQRSISIFTLAFFIPTASQRTAGARWVRCDLIATKPDGTAVDLPAASGPALAAGLADKYAICLSANNSGAIVTCDEPHVLRGLDQFAYPDPPKKLPSQSAARAVATARCKPLAKGSRWIALLPSRTSWAKGDHQVVCWGLDQGASSGGGGVLA